MPKKLPELSQSASWLINAGIDDMQRGLDGMTGTAQDIADLQAALAHETSKPKLSGGSRVSRVKPMESKLRKFQSSLSNNQLSIPSPSALLTGDSSTFLSPAEVSSLTEIDQLVADTAIMISRTKGMAHATTAGRALSGINLRRIREYYLGPRRKGRPAKTETNAGFPRWKELLDGPFDISDSTADNWIKTGEAVMSLAEAQGTDLRTICEKLPWHWTPEETSFVKNTFQLLCKDKTQRQLMQADFLEGLGFENKQDKHGTNNPGGKNGGKKKPSASPKALLEERRRLARLDFFGTENPGKIKPGSPVWHIEEFLKNPAEHALSTLPKPELLDLIENTLSPLIKALKKLTN